MAKRAQLSQLLQHRRAEEQPVSWEPERWLKRPHNPTPGRVRLLESNVLHKLMERRPDGRLLRSDISTVADNPTDLLIASMAWGFGPIGYGPYRTGRMLDTPNVDGIVADIVEATQRGGAGTGFAALFKPTGAGRVFGLGVAMGTKVLYFTSRERQVPGAQPLVYDQWVYAAITQLSEKEAPRLDGAPLPNPKRWVSRRAYEAWCEWAAHRADEHRVAPDDVEFALFAFGNPTLS